MTDGHVMRYFPSSQCLWPAIDENKIRELADKHTLSHQELGRKIRGMLKPVHYTCVSDADLTADPPKFLPFDPLGRQSTHPDLLVKAKDLSKNDLMNMPESEAEYKQFQRNRKKCQPFGWWDLQDHTYKY